jgi:hypothetical protein
MVWASLAPEPVDLFDRAGSHTSESTNIETLRTISCAQPNYTNEHTDCSPHHIKIIFKEKQQRDALVQAGTVVIFK